MEQKLDQILSVLYKYYETTCTQISVRTSRLAKIVRSRQTWSQGRESHWYEQAVLHRKERSWHPTSACNTLGTLLIVKGLHGPLLSLLCSLVLRVVCAFYQHCISITVTVCVEIFVIAHHSLFSTAIIGHKNAIVCIIAIVIFSTK